MTQDIFNLGLSRRDPLEEARFISLQRVRGYWEGLIGPGGALPGPAALDPRGLLPALEDVFLAERIGEGLLRLRIAGRRVSAPAGMDMQGLPLSALFLPEARPALAQTIERVCKHRSLVTMELIAEGGIGRTGLTARMLLLPLEAPVRGMPAILGCFSTLGEIGRTPRRFSVSSVIEERLAYRLPAEPGPELKHLDLPEFALSEEAAAFSAQPECMPEEIGQRAGADIPADAPPARPRLRLVHSQD